MNELLRELKLKRLKTLQHELSLYKKEEWKRRYKIILKLKKELGLI